jgi:hypothetical protein
MAIVTGPHYSVTRAIGGLGIMIWKMAVISTICTSMNLVKDNAVLHFEAPSLPGFLASTEESLLSYKFIPVGIL